MKWQKTATGWRRGAYEAVRETVYRSRKPWKLYNGSEHLGGFFTLAALMRNADRHAATGRLIGG